MKTFLLVHGSWQSSYTWKYVKKKLEEKGQKVLTVDLPGHGNDHTDPGVLTLDSYVMAVTDIINTISDKVILVGHSSGGMVVSAVAELVPGRIEKLIYIGAFVPADGQSLMDISVLDKKSQVGAAVIPSPDFLTLDIKADDFINILCHDADEEDKKMALDHYRVAPAVPSTSQVKLTGENFGSIPKFYIYTLQDRSISIDLQVEMAAVAGISVTYSLNSSHAPQLSMPDTLSGLLLEIADIT